MHKSNHLHSSGVSAEQNLTPSGRKMVYPDDFDNMILDHENSLLPLKEDVSKWLRDNINVDITAEDFMNALDNGVILCEIARYFQNVAVAKDFTNLHMDYTKIHCNKRAKTGSWLARDNIANFLAWCKRMKMSDDFLFETEGLFFHKDSRNVVLCLLQIIRMGRKFGIKPSGLIQLEEEIEMENLLNRSFTSSSCSSDSAVADLWSRSNSIDCSESLVDTSSFENVFDVLNCKQDVNLGTTPHSIVDEVSDDKHSDKFIYPSAIPVRTKANFHMNSTPKSKSTPRSRLPVKTPDFKIISTISNEGCGLTSRNATSMLDKEVLKISRCFSSSNLVSKLTDGKYFIYGKMVLVRMLNDRHVMVRVGGGWETLNFYMKSRDPRRLGSMKRSAFFATGYFKTDLDPLVAKLVFD